MGSHEGWAQPDGFYPNGLLPDETASVTQMLDLERWSIAEDRIAELIVHIQPNQPSEARRNAVANYVQQLITKCSSCQVCIFGSVPLKTYLPDGDIDLTAFSTDQNLKDTWASEVRSMLENEEKRGSAEFCVKEVQYIQAEVKIIKCLVENIVVDISFNQLGGLSTLCFLEVVDNLINQNHLFKRSVILIKAWCYYESRILGAHHGLISTYALETLVLYIFHLFNNDFTGPLEVLYRFLEFFSKFDWENFCVSLWGPVPVGSLPKVIVQSPRKDGGELLLSKAFYHACTTHSAFPGGQENNEQPFISKHFNVIDPLRTNNNLGRSVSKGNFFRIRSAFAFGAERLARLLDCPKESISAEVDQFFLNTWKRHGKGYRPDAPNYDNLYGLRPLNTNHVNGSAGNLRNSSSSKKVKEKSTGHDSKPVENHGSRAYNGVLLQQGNQLFKRTINNMADSQSQKKFSNLNSSATSDRNHQVTPGYKSNINGQTDNGRNCRLDYARDKINSNYQFAKTHSSPELKERYNDNSYQDRHCRAPESIKDQTLIAKLDYKRRNFGPEASDDNGARSSREEVPSSRQFSSLHSIDPKSASNRYCGESGSSSMREDQMQMHQEEQDLVNMMASSRVHNLSSGHVQMPYNLASSHLPALASLGYANRNSGGMVPNSIEMPWASHMYYSQGLVSMPVSQFTSRVGMGAPHHQQEIAEPIEDCFIPKETYHDDSDNGQWSEWNENAIRSCHTADDESFQGHKLEERKPLTSGGSTNISAASHLPSHENYLMKVHGSMKEDRGAKENYGDSSRHQNTRRTQATSSMSKLSSEGSCDGLSLKSFKSAGDNSGGRKSVPSTTEQHSTVHNHGWQHETDSVDYVSPRADDDSGEWVPIESDVAAEDMVRETVAPLMRFHQRPSYEPAELSGSHSVVPVAPVPVGSSDSRQRIYDNNGALPFAFYPTGPPVPFVTMLPFYNFPTEVGTSDGSRSCSDRDDDFNKSHSDPSRQRLYENLEHPQSSSSQSNLKGTAASVEESSGELKSDDILTGDFTSHWQNLQYGRFCQNPQNQGPMVYPPPSVGASAPVCIQGQLPWDGPGRPLCANANLFTQLMGYGPGAVPLSPLQADSNRPGSAYQSSGDELPRYRAGTGTYLPNPKNSSREWQSSSNARNTNRGNYSKDYYHGDRGDLKWNNNSSKQQQRFSGRGQGRNHSEKPNNSRIDRSSGANTNSRSDRPWDSSYRPDKKLQNSNHSSSQNGPPIHSSSSNSSRHGHGPTTKNNNVAAASYGMYHHPLPVMNNNPNGGVAPPSASTNNNVVPSVVMFYPPPCDQNTALGEQRQLKFGSIGPIQLGESSSQHRNFPVDSGHSSPDLPTSPLHHQR